MNIRLPNISREYKYCNYFLLSLIAFSIFFITPQGQSILSFHHIGEINCFYKEVTGHPCKTCGMTRALQALMVGNYDSAVIFHPWSHLVFILLIIEVCLRLLVMLLTHLLVPWIDIAQLMVVTFITFQLII